MKRVDLDVDISVDIGDHLHAQFDHLVQDLISCLGASGVETIAYCYFNRQLLHSNRLELFRQLICKSNGLFQQLLMAVVLEFAIGNGLWFRW